MSFAYIAAFTGCVIAFVAGTSLTWSSPELEKLNSTDKTVTPLPSQPSSEDLSWVGSLVALGAAVGPFIFGYAADAVGRKWTLLSLGIPFLLCYIILAFAKTIGLFFAARFIIGLAVGGIFTVLPMYLGEVADDSNRGALGSSMNCFICFGLVLSYSIGPYVSVKVFNIILAVFPAAFIALFFFVAPETPQYYLSKGKREEAKQALEKIRGGYEDTVEKELQEIEMKINSEGKGTFLDIFKSRGLIKALVISVGLVGFQQLSGINAVLFYAQTIFKSTGTSLEPAVCSIIIGCVQFGTSFITPVVADRLGRKILLIGSAIGMMISEIPLGVYSYLKDHDKDVSSYSWVPVLSLVLYIVTYNCGFGPLPWAVMGELFPASVKSAASSATAAICWLLGFLVTQYFQTIVDGIGIGPAFWIFAGFCGAAAAFSAFYVVETKGKSLSEIQELLDG